jgi:hypothetical protein
MFFCLATCGGDGIARRRKLGLQRGDLSSEGRSRVKWLRRWDERPRFEIRFLAIGVR